MVISKPKKHLNKMLGRRDSNPRVLGPEPSALPLGDDPIIVVAVFAQKNV